MGNPKKQKKSYTTPKKAWEKERIEEEKELVKEYYFKNKREIWKLTSKLRDFSMQAKKLIPLKTPQAEKEKTQLLTKLKQIGILPESARIDDVLGITAKDLFNRRLQCLVFKKGLARSMKQARQFIAHGHILVDGKKIISPNFIVPKSKEQMVNFSPDSAFSNEMHPERIQEEKLPKKQKEEPKPNQPNQERQKGSAEPVQK